MDVGYGLHRHNLATNTEGRGGQNRPEVLGTSVYDRVMVESLVLTSPLYFT